MKHTIRLKSISASAKQKAYAEVLATVCEEEGVANPFEDKSLTKKILFEASNLWEDDPRNTEWLK